MPGEKLKLVCQWPPKIRENYWQRLSQLWVGRSTETAPIHSQLLSVEIVQTDRYEMPLGSEKRRIDNLTSDAHVERRIKVSRQWKAEYRLDASELRKTTTGLSVGWNASHVERTAQMQIVETFEIGTSTGQTHEEEVTVTVPPHSALNLEFRWKQLMQRGFVRFASSNGREAFSIPFEVVVGITFDQYSSV